MAAYELGSNLLIEMDRLRNPPDSDSDAETSVNSLARSDSLHFSPEIASHSPATPDIPSPRPSKTKLKGITLFLNLIHLFSFSLYSIPKNVI